MIIDYYSVLGVNPGATSEQIKAAFKKAALKWHPDMHMSEGEKERKFAEDMFKKCKQAYDGLCAGVTFGEWSDTSERDEDKCRKSQSMADYDRASECGSSMNLFTMIMAVLLFVAAIILGVQLVIWACHIIAWIVSAVISVLIFIWHTLIAVAVVVAIYKIITFII